MIVIILISNMTFYQDIKKSDYGIAFQLEIN